MNRRSNKRQTYEEFEDVEILKESPRAFLARFPGGRERWIPISQTPQGFEWEVGKTQTIEVSTWLTEQDDWEAAPKAEEDVSIPDVVCLKETARALEVRAGKGEAIWIPKSHVRETSEVRGDGDRGVLTVSLWIARAKGFVEGEGPDGPSVADDVRGQRRQTGLPFQEEFFPDDDVPF